MKIGYMPDTHSGAYDQPLPSRETVADFAEQLLEEGEQAERSGFDGVFFPERHARTECVFPPPLGFGLWLQSVIVVWRFAAS